MNPKISVIVPVYNKEKYLEQCLDSIANQTLREIEIILVDDDSTDSSISIMTKYAAKDSRIKALAQEHKGAGAARNYGLRNASGEYLSFLDGDDWFELTMLEKMYNKALSCGADIVWCRTRGFDDTAKTFENMDWMLRALPQKDIFSYKDIQDDFVCAFPCAWDKLFKHAFIKENALWFQELDNMNDAYFTIMSVYHAKTISLVDEILVNYRKNIADSLTNNLKKNITSCLAVYNAIQSDLEKMGLFPSVKHLFFSWALSDAFFRLYIQEQYPAFSEMFYAVKNNVLPMIDFEKKEENYFCEYLRWLYNDARLILKTDEGEYLFSKMKEAWRNDAAHCAERDSLRAERDGLWAERDGLWAERDGLWAERDGLWAERDNLRAEKQDIENSLSFRIGRKITYLPRKARGAYRHLRENGFIYTIKLLLKKITRKTGLKI